MLLFYRRHPVFAARDILGIRLSTHQRIQLKALWFAPSNIIHLGGRGVGKTFIYALVAVLRGILFSGEKILFIGASGFRQSKEIINNCEAIINGELESQERLNFAKACIRERKSKNVIIKDADEWTIKFMNGSFIKALPIGSTGDKIRSQRSTFTMIDEGKDLSQETETKVIKPFSVVYKDPVGDSESEKPVVAKSGTIGFEGDYYSRQIEEYEKQMLAGSKDYGIIKMTYLDTYTYNRKGEKTNWKIPYKMDIKEIEAGRDNGLIAYEDWAAEYICEPIRNAGTYYPWSLIEGISNYKVDEERDVYLEPLLETEEPVVVGVDVATESDFSTIVVIRLGPLSRKEWNPKTQEGRTSFCNLIYAWQDLGVPYPQLAQRIRDLYKSYPNILKIAMDFRGGGVGVRHNLAYDNIEPVIYDPTDTEVAVNIKSENALPVLTLIKATDRDNTAMNSFTKGQMQTSKFLLPKPFTRHEDKRAEDVYRFVRILQSQFRNIRTRPTQSALNFYVKEGKKDFHSATIYALSVAQPYLYLPQETNEILNEVVFLKI